MKAMSRLRLFYLQYVMSLVIAFLCPVVTAQVNVVTWHGDLARTGANTSETVLSTSNVNPNTFGKLFTAAVDGPIYAQPLYLSNVNISGVTHNVLIVATAANTLFAFDALSGNQLWSRNYGTPPTADDVNSKDINGQIGIIGTPVIDPKTNTVYLVERNKNTDGSFHQFLRAVDIASGNDVFGSPQEIKATLAGLTFDPLIHNQRPALVLSNGTVYISWASHGDHGAYHGWIIGYQASNIEVQQYVFSDTLSTNNAKGGIWMGGGAFPVDSAGNIYAITGNGLFDGTSNFGDSFIKLTPNLQVSDYFAPFNQASLSGQDQDLGASSPILIPGTTSVLGGGKDGRLFLVDTHNMGHFNASTDAVLQEFQGFTTQLRSGPVYWNSPVIGPTVYLWSGQDAGKAYSFNNGLLNTTPTLTPENQGNGALAISANGSTAGTGILWANEGGELHAYDASNISNELWHSNQNRGRDGFGASAKWVPPIIANGIVYMATNSNIVVAYGILGSIPPPPPTNLVAIPGDAQISLAWNPDTGATSYDVLRSTASGTETLLASGVQAGGYVDRSAVNGTTYFYTVTATNGTTFSSASNEASTTAGMPVTGTAIYRISTAGAQPPLFMADAFFTGGNISNHNGNTITTVGVIDPAPLPVYQSERNGVFSYIFPNLTPNAPYLVRLHFAEVFFSAVGKRLFNIDVNKVSFLKNFDIFASADGENKAIVVPYNATAAPDGTIEIDFNSGNADQPKVSGIEILSPTSNAPAAPTGLKATSGNGQVTLSWVASAGATSYQVFRSTVQGGEGSTPIATNLPGTMFVDSGLTNGTTYFYNVKAVNTIGASTASNEVSATPLSVPVPPTLLTALPGNGSVALSWTAVSGAATYNVYAGTSAGGESLVPVITNLVGTSFVSMGLTNGTTYFFTVKAVNTAGTSTTSNELSATPIAPVATPAPPANLTAIAGNAQVTLNWSASSGATSYNVLRGTAPGGENATPISTGITGTTFLDNNLINGTTYYYEVVAVNGMSVSGVSNETFATPQAPSGNLVAVYQINAGGSTTGSFAADNFFNAGTVSTKNLTVSTTGAADAAPAAVYLSDRVGTFTYALPGLTPGAPYTVRLHFAEVFWTAAGKRLFNVAINKVSALSKFDIFATAGGGNIAVVKSFTTTADANGLITIAFTNGGADQAEVSGIEVLTDGALPMPAAPVSLAATAGNNQVLLSWRGGNGPGGTYSVFRGTSPGAENTLIISGLNATHFVDTQITNLATYYYTVKAVNNTAASNPSNEVSVVPGAPVVGTPVYRVNAGGAGVLSYAADEFFNGGNGSGSTKTINTNAVVSPAPPSVYQTERSGGSFSYTFPNLTPGSQYLVRLHFAEFFWTAAGQRVFNVSINNTPVLQDFDIVAIAGAPNTALVEQFMATADATGNITVTYSKGMADQPKASALEIYQP